MSFWKQLIISAALLVGSVVIFALMSFGPGLFWDASASAGAQTGGRLAPLVVLAPVKSGTTDSVVKSVGTARAIAQTILYPEAAGRIEQIAARSGQRIDRGEAIIQLDSNIQQIAVDRAHIALNDAQHQVERYKALAAQDTVTDVQLRDAVSMLETAQLDLQEAQDALERRWVRAPFAGDVGLIDIGVGDYVTTATPVTSLDDRQTLLVEFKIPERFANQVSEGLPISLSTPAAPELQLTGIVAGTDSRIDPASRTMTVQGIVANDADLIRPGMSFEVVLDFPGNNHTSVPSPAVQWDSDGSYVFKAYDNAATRTPVEIISRQSGQVLVKGDLSEGDLVVNEGTSSVRPGQPFRVYEAKSGAVEPNLTQHAEYGV